MIREVQGSLTFMASGLELAEESRRAANEGAPERRRVSAAGRVGTSRGPRETGGRAGGLWGGSYGPHGPLGVGLGLFWASLSVIQIGLRRRLGPNVLKKR